MRISHYLHWTRSEVEALSLSRLVRTYVRLGQS